ncbi:MAG: hypothetical protein JWM57_1838, partial [Phycisphaerales bacterium]|nr:hypothetical protein [Phycisphaerales bacterium]
IPLVSVETVLATGPLLGLIGGILTGVAATQRRWVLVILGIGHLAIVGLFAGLVNSFNWGPSYAEMPFLVMAFVWTAVAATGTTLSWRLERMFAANPFP